MAFEQSSGCAAPRRADLSVGKSAGNVGVSSTEWTEQLAANVVVGEQTLADNLPVLATCLIHQLFWDFKCGFV